MSKIFHINIREPGSRGSQVFSCLPVRPTNITTLATFHHKILRGFLHLSSTVPVQSLSFLLGEVLIGAKLHLDLIVLFYNIWSNPSAKIHLLEYLLMMTDNNSTTWANHVRIIFSIYSLPDPLSLLQQPAWTKSQWKEVTKTAITVHMERKWRGISQQNSKMKYFNVDLLGLSGHCHPIIKNITNARDIPNLGPILSF